MSEKITNEQKNKVLEYLKPLVSEETLDNMKFALDNNMPILIKGSQKPTGKTTLCNMLREYAISAKRSGTYRAKAKVTNNIFARYASTGING